MWLALIASIDGNALAPVAAAVVTGSFAWLVQAWRYRREVDDKATQALRHNRDPLLRAVFDLQSRLYNIVARGFFDHYWIDAADEERHYARCSTLWLFGQFLGWTEILRREVQFLDLGSRATNREVQRRLNDVSAALASDSYDRDNTLIVFRSDQRAIGEFMVTERDTQEGKRPDCLGYSEFIEALARLEGLTVAADPAAVDSPVLAWAERFTTEIDAVAAAGPGDMAQARLVRVQRRLVNLLDLLDPERLRYPRPDLRGRLPWMKADMKPRPMQVARFVWPWGDPWLKVDAWVEGSSLRPSAASGAKRAYRGRTGPLGGHPEFQLVYEHGWFTISAWTGRGKRAKRVNGSLRSWRTRLALNDLLDRFDRPLVIEATKPFRLVEWIRRRAHRLFGQ